MIYSIWILFSAAVLLAVSIRQLRCARHLRILGDVALPPQNPAWPKISLIIPACNEEATIGSAISTLLQIDYPQLEIIAIDDRSTDGTGKILETIARENADVRVVTVDELPPDWLGKVHAQFKGVEQATGDWILFTDADVHFEKESLCKAIHYCQENGLEFMTLIPDIAARGAAFRVAMTQFLMVGALSVDIPKVRDPQSMEGIGCGAFNLVKTEAYRRSRGLEWLRMEVIDDGGFALMMKYARVRSDVLSGLRAVELEWYPNFRAYVRGLEKNSFSLFQYGFFALSVFTAAVAVWIAGLFVVPFLGESWVSAGILPIFLLYHVSNYRVLRKVSRFPFWVILFLPATMLISLFIVWRAAILFALRGGIYWRRTFYGKAKLVQYQRLKAIRFLIFKKFD